MSPAHGLEPACLSSQFRDLEVDVTRGRAVVHLADGRTAVMPLTPPPPGESSEIARMVYSPAARTHAITTPGGETAIIEIEPPGATAQRGGRHVVYLDQGHWSTLARRISDPGSVTGDVASIVL